MTTFPQLHDDERRQRKERDEEGVGDVQPARRRLAAMYKSFLKHGRPECCCRTQAPASSAPLGTALLVARRCCIASWLHFLRVRNISMHSWPRVRRAKRRPSLPAFCGETKFLDVRPPRASSGLLQLSRLPRRRLSSKISFAAAPGACGVKKRLPLCHPLYFSSLLVFAPRALLLLICRRRNNEGRRRRRSIYKCRLCFPP